MKACPYRADFYAKLVEDKSGGPPASEEKLNEQLDKWLAALERSSNGWKILHEGETRQGLLMIWARTCTVRGKAQQLAILTELNDGGFDSVLAGGNIILE
jgi:hypothetical protein